MPRDMDYVWKNGELQLYGSELEFNVLNAENTVSDPWYAIDKYKKEAGLRIWKVQKYRATPWPQEEYGHFYDQNVFIVLSTRYTNLASEIPNWDVHMWVGKHASREDYNAAAKKAMELDEHLNHEAMVHREVQGLESELFISYFNPLTAWKGSADERYLAVRNKGTYPARLLHLYRVEKHLNNYKVSEIEADKKRIEPDYVYILDIGHALFQWIGPDCTSDDIFRGLKYAEELKANRGGTNIDVQLVDENTPYDHYFYFYLKDSSKTSTGDKTGTKLKRQETQLVKNEATLIEVTSVRNKTKYNTKKKGMIRGADLKNYNTCIVDTRKHCFVWIGQRAALDEKKLGIEYAHNYLRQSSNSLVPITIMVEGQMSAALDRVLAS